MPYYAHSHEVAEYHGLAEHLRAVARRAEEITSGKLRLPGWGTALGLGHDLGKYSAEFQARLNGAPEPVDHSTYGAQLAVQKYGRIGKLLAYGIAGHHGGLPDAKPNARQAQGTALVMRLERQGLPDASAWATELSLPGGVPVPNVRDPVDIGYSIQCATRIAFSALVDADHLDTEDYYLAADNRPSVRGGWPSLADLASRLDEHMSAFQADTEVRRIRAEILAAARAASGLKQGIYSYTVPTGGGKTLSSLVWALGHALANGQDRVIVVIPFTSIIEQTAEVIRNALGDLAYAVIEHHSAYRERSDGHALRVRKASENWDAPIVVTTNVQFYESLYANKPGRCRKLHNVANAVVVIDEAQSLPPNLLLPCLAALREMACGYSTSILLCTATQPAILADAPGPSALPGGLKSVREIAPPGLHGRLRRVRVEQAGQLSDQQLAAEMAEHDQGLAIVNTRDHAKALYGLLASTPGAVHLSAVMCPAHRSVKLADIKRRMRAGQAVRLVSTNLIEAGVDVDFPRVWRAMTGLSSIAQAAGRCNREGLLEGLGVVRVFRPADVPVPSYMATDVQAAASTLHRFLDDPLSPNAIERSFAEYYMMLLAKRPIVPGGSGLDERNVLGKCRGDILDANWQFEEIAADVRIIDDIYAPVIIPYDDEAGSALAELAASAQPLKVLRRLQRYTVTIPEDDFEVLKRRGDIAEAAQGADAEIWTLTNLARYRDDLGLIVD